MLVVESQREGRKDSSPCASSYQGLPVVASTVNVDIAYNAIAALAAESLLAVALLGGRLIPLHSQVVVGDLQLLVGCFGVQFEWLAYFDRSKWKERESEGR